MEECGTGDGFVVGMGDDDEGAAEQGSKRVHACVVMLFKRVVGTLSREPRFEEVKVMFRPDIGALVL